MIGIREIFNALAHHTPLSFENKMHTLYYKKMDEKVLTYLKKILKGLYIEVTEDYEGVLFELMSDELLEGWCWQTTESAILFFQDDDCIERGILKFGYNYPDYDHSWICFTFEGEEYVFDSCLAILCKKEDYYKTFLVERRGKVSAREVKRTLWNQIHMFHQERTVSCEKSLRQKFLNGEEREIVMSGPEDLNTPFYRNHVGYKVQTEEEKIKKIVAHYYD